MIFIFFPFAVFKSHFDFRLWPAKLVIVSDRDFGISSASAAVPWNVCEQSSEDPWHTNDVVNIGIFSASLTGGW